MVEHLDKNECVYKLSGSVKTSCGVGKIALTQKRLFLLTEGRPGYVEIATFRNIEVGPAAAVHRAGGGLFCCVGSCPSRGGSPSCIVTRRVPGAPFPNSRVRCVLTSVQRQETVAPSDSCTPAPVPPVFSTLPDI